MAVNLHSNGKFRAYKKIKGKEYQFYFSSLTAANRKQKELDSISKLSPIKLFRSDGSIVGLSSKVERRPKRKPSISLRLQIKGKTKEVSYKGNFEKMWRDCMKHWRELRGLSKYDAHSYRSEIREAKRYYIRLVGQLELIV